ncbi:protoporphyrinogen oxidase [Chelonus insularis]|uniref:protoporphyrinogen oxidase n=1 Tax=Chelonus insularis TaxID=460826 RepID=UPI00158D91E6|nr:protoporphyrinogen oxidase [Chelonus insularis]
MTAVLGGGISGLAAAYYALENSRLGAITILEASNRVGGWIRTCQSPSGAIFEKGPRTIRNSGPVTNTLKLVENLNLSDKILPFTTNHTISGKRYIYANNQLVLLPSSMMDLFKIKPPFKRPLITCLWTDWKAPKVQKEDESVHSFVSRRLGQDIADYLVSPLICGICAGDAHKISVKFLMPSVFEGEQKYGTIVKGLIKTGREEDQQIKKEGRALYEKSKKEREAKAKQNLNNNKEQIKEFDNQSVERKTMSPLVKRSKLEKWNVWTIDDGLEVIPKTLKEYLELKNVNICLNNICENITFQPDCVEVRANGKAKKYSKIISSLPANHLATLIEQQHPQLAEELRGIPFVTVGVINIEFSGHVLPVDGFGFLVPPKENLPILGVIFDSSIRSGLNSTVLSVMMGGVWFDHYFGQNPTEEYLTSIALEHVKRILKIEEDPLHVDASILKDCIPQHIVGHSKRIERIRHYISTNKLPLALCGSSYHGVGINDVILSAKNAVEDFDKN